MAALKGEASFKASDGTTYNLVLDFNAFAEAEEVAGMDVDSLIKAVTPIIDPKTMAVIKRPLIKHLGALLYGALAAHHPGMSMREVNNLFAEDGCGEAIAKALEGALPKPKPSAEGKALPADGTGTKPKRTGRAKS